MVVSLRRDCSYRGCPLTLCRLEKPYGLSHCSIHRADLLRPGGIKTGFLGAFATFECWGGDSKFSLEPPFAIPATLSKELGRHKILSVLGWAVPLSIVMGLFDRWRSPHNLSRGGIGSSKSSVTSGVGGGGLTFQVVLFLFPPFTQDVRLHLLLVLMVVVPNKLPLSPQGGVAISVTGGGREGL